MRERQREVALCIHIERHNTVRQEKWWSMKGIGDLQMVENFGVGGLKVNSRDKTGCEREGGWPGSGGLWR